MPFRRTKGIISDVDASDPKQEGDVIMTAATVGFTATYIQDDRPIQFDMDPLDVPDQAKSAAFTRAVTKIDAAIADFLKKNHLEPKNKVYSGVCPGYTTGAVIVGVYKLAGQEAPPSISAPVLSRKGQALYDRIKDNDPSLVQYTGRGAYTGFMDNKNTVGNTDPVGPRPTARFLAPDLPELHPRWLPAKSSPLWIPRKRRGTDDSDDSYVPWGLIGGDEAGKDPKQPNTTKATNLSDQITMEMAETWKMVFNGVPARNDVATYTHGMIQAIYKAYSLGPSCTPYEIAVGDQTKKMASCIPCTLFMVATGYPPTSTHLGRGESWAPLYGPYNPSGEAEHNELAVIRDLNNAWFSKCTEFLTLGLDILDDGHIAADHISSRDAVRSYLAAFPGDTVAGTLVLDAITMHDAETERINRTLK